MYTLFRSATAVALLVSVLLLIASVAYAGCTPPILKRGAVVIAIPLEWGDDGFAEGESLSGC